MIDACLHYLFFTLGLLVLQATLIKLVLAQEFKV